MTDPARDLTTGAAIGKGDVEIREVSNRSEIDCRCALVALGGS